MENFQSIIASLKATDSSKLVFVFNQIDATGFQPNWRNQVDASVVVYLLSVPLVVEAVYFELQVGVVVAECGAVDAESGPVRVKIIPDHRRLADRGETPARWMTIIHQKFDSNCSKFHLLSKFCPLTWFQ